MRYGYGRQILATSAALLTTALLTSAAAGEPQSLSATIDGAAFVSDDGGITLVPLGDGPGNFTLVAITAGGSVYPPPKTPLDRLSITCSGLEAGKPLRLDSKHFGRAECDATFARGVKPMGGDPDAEYRLDKSSAENLFEIESAAGRRYTGHFRLRFLDASGATHLLGDGRFIAEDRQL
jgi:hypothetical protein